MPAPTSKNELALPPSPPLTLDVNRGLVNMLTPPDVTNDSSLEYVNLYFLYYFTPSVTTTQNEWRDKWKKANKNKKQKSCSVTIKCTSCVHCFANRNKWGSE